MTQPEPYRSSQECPSCLQLDYLGGTLLLTAHQCEFKRLLDSHKLHAPILAHLIVHPKRGGFIDRNHHRFPLKAASGWNQAYLTDSSPAGEDKITAQRQIKPLEERIRQICRRADTFDQTSEQVFEQLKALWEADNNSVETKIKVATIMVRIVKEKIKEMQKRERGDK